MNDIDKYHIETTRLGYGAFSEVFLGTEISSNKKVAVKKINLNKNMIIIEKLNLEIKIMKELDHPNIVKYYDLVTIPNYWYIIMEYCNAGTLYDVIEFNQKMFNDKTLLLKREMNTYYYLNQLKNALNYIRKNGYVHRDIKPKNVLLTKVDTDASYKEEDILFPQEQIEISSDQKNFFYTEKLIIKLADFGLAKQQYEENESMSHTICGSPLYMAPEIFNQKKYNSKIDLWSYGIIMYELLFGNYPYTTNSFGQLKKNLEHIDIDFHLEKNYTPACFDILTKLLSKDPNQRINWIQFFNHKWFTQWVDKNFQEKNMHQNTTFDSKNIILPNNIPSSSGYSNLSKMKMNNFSFYIKPGSYSDFPSSYPPLTRSISQNTSINIPWKDPFSDNLKSNSLPNRIYHINRHNPNNDTTNFKKSEPILIHDQIIVPSSLSYVNSPIGYAESFSK